ncbi:Fic family protein [Sanguibacter sp. HDW7]|uniref:Fic family protein n=1 Tax=Sanguibacter sp. HDW7 TaxID=2714931 RepID=UPI001408B104|nr:Fic family protein [Sanguibacter sp. HDW7]QIK84510.1 Fic family protein [Sanguibacter sp. HDW7]
MQSADDALEVPAVGSEPDYWVADSDGMTSRRAMAAASGPYERAVTPEIAALRLAIPADLVADLEEAAAALASFDRHAAAALGPESPTLGPMSSILLHTESSSSSQIENLTVSARQLALAQIDESTSVNARVVAANVATMEAALRLADHLDAAAICEMHRVLLSAQPGGEEHAGLFREQLVWVGTSAVSPRGAVHVAPHHERVPAAIDDLVAFMARDDLPVVAQTAIAHAQFETIHPFVDGNGRTGRALIHATMHAKGLVTRTTAPLSAGLLTDTSAYTDALTAYRTGDARPIVEQLVRAALFAASSGSRLVDDLAAQVAEGREALAATGLRSQAGAWKVLPVLVAQPVLNSRFLQERLGMNQVGAQRALDQLVAAGLLVERTGQRRNRVWEHGGIVTVLDAYAAGLRRR